MNDPKITVLMSVYNGEKYLRKAIESILNQTFTDFEFLIINDGSTDHSAEICRSYSDPRICVVSNRANKGLTRSLNKGLYLAKGEYIARLDADDVALPQRLQAQVAFLDTHLDVCILGTDYETIDESSNYICTKRVETNPLALRFILLFNNPICHSSVMFRKDPILEMGGYDERAVCAEDFDLWNRLASIYQIANLDTPMVRLRLHKHSLTQTSMIPPEEQGLRIVRNVHLLTGQKISSEVGFSLYEQSTFKPFNLAIICKAYTTIELCFSTLIIREDRKHEDCRILLFLTLDKLERIANLTPNTPRRALRIALWLALQHSPDVIFNRKFVRFAWRMIVPGGMRKRLLPYYPKCLRSG